jgi:hypothetical protein
MDNVRSNIKETGSKGVKRINIIQKKTENPYIGGFEMSVPNI